MQREKLYNLHNKMYFNYIVFGFIKKAKLIRPTFVIVKKIVFSTRTKDSCIFHPFYHLINFIKKRQNIPQDAASKALQFTQYSIF